MRALVRKEKVHFPCTLILLLLSIKDVLMFKNMCIYMRHAYSLRLR